MKMKKVILLALLISLGTGIYAQEIINVPTIDKLTYEQYQKKEWAQLIETGKKSLDNDIDFYYLQLRMGIAYYELKKYSLAIKYFENAHKHNKKDDIVLEYLYYTYIFSGNYDDARTLSPYMSEKLYEKLKIGSHAMVYSLYFDTKHNFNKNIIIEPEVGEIVEQIAVKNQSYYNISLEHLFGKRVRIYHGFSHLQIANEVQEIPHDLLESRYKEDIKQNEYYFSMKILIAKQTTLNTAVHFISSTFSSIDEANSRRNRPSYFYNYKIKSFAGSMMLTKNFPYFSSSIGSGLSTLNGNFQVQPEANIIIKPKANNTLQLNSKFIYHIENNNEYYTYTPIFKQAIGIAVTKNLYIEPSATFGRLFNFTEYNAMIANNDLDIIKQRYEALFSYNSNNQKVNLFVKYSYNLKENKYKINSIPYSQDYINQSITGGIKWYF